MTRRAAPPATVPANAVLPPRHLEAPAPGEQIASHDVRRAARALEVTP